MGKIYEGAELKKVLSKIGVSKNDFYKCKYSVSKVISTLETPFDAEAMSLHCFEKYYDDPSSQYYHMSQDDIKEMWVKNSEDSKACGRLLDDFIGSKLEKQTEAYKKKLKSEMDVAPAAWINKLNAFEKFLNEELLPQGLEFMSREKDLASSVLNVRGRFDAIFTKDNVVYLIDWKNSKEINVSSKYGKKLHGPLSKYDDCELNKYTVQLYIYKYILKHVFGIDNKIVTLVAQVMEDKVMVYSPGIPYSDELVEDIASYAETQLNLE